jgi:homocysteine S-methyltransferase
MSARLALAPDALLLTDGGLETVLIFSDGIDLPAFAAFPLLSDAAGVAVLERYSGGFLDVAADAGAGFVLETPTWRAGPDWAAELGYSVDDLRRVADAAVLLGRDLLEGWPGAGPAWVSGCLGPRGESFDPEEAMSSAQAADYHATQVAQLAAAGADLVTAFTLGYVEEAVGVVTAAAACGVPSVVGFTVETDGRLPSGTPLAEAVQQVDEATGSASSWFMVNCAHPEHVLAGLPPSSGASDAGSLARIRAYRPNPSRLSHAELDAAETLDDGDPAELADGVRWVRRRLPGVQVIGGCCGTDVRHVRAMAQTLALPAS